MKKPTDGIYELIYISLEVVLITFVTTGWLVLRSKRQRILAPVLLDSARSWSAQQHGGDDVVPLGVTAK